MSLGIGAPPKKFLITPPKTRTSLLSIDRPGECTLLATSPTRVLAVDLAPKTFPVSLSEVGTASGWPWMKRRALHILQIL